MRVFLALDLAAGMREAAWAWGRGLAGAIGGDTADALAARILVEEHRIYPAAIARVLAAGWRIDGRRVVWR